MDQPEVDAAVAALEELVRSEGWKHVQTYAHNEHGAKASLRLLHGAVGKSTNPDEIGLAAARMMAAREAVEQIIAYPNLAILQHKKRTTPEPAGDTAAAATPPPKLDRAGQGRRRK